MDVKCRGRSYGLVADLQHIRGNASSKIHETSGGECKERNLARTRRRQSSRRDPSREESMKGVFDLVTVNVRNRLSLLT